MNPFDIMMHNVMYKKQDTKKSVINGFEITVDAKTRVPTVFIGLMLSRPLGLEQNTLSTTLKVADRNFVAKRAMSTNLTILQLMER